MTTAADETLTAPSPAPAARGATPRLRTRRPRYHSVDRPKRSLGLTLVTGLVLLYSLVPLAWLVINATKTQAGLFDSFGLWFHGDFALFGNIHDTLTYDDGIFLRWLLNTLLYVVLGAGGATALAVAGGYALAKFDFPGKRGVFALV